MERFVARSAWVVAIAMLVGCSASEDPVEQTAVAGVVLEREDGAVDEQVNAITDLVLLTSGPAASGTVWFAAEGGWVGLDGQTLEAGRELAILHFDASLDIVDDQGGQAAAGCEVHLTAPEDAQLQARGIIEGELIVERSSGELERSPLTPLSLDLQLEPGDDHRQVVAVLDRTARVDADRDAQVRCEGRFSRT